jgi:hypothetical protein
MIEFLLIITLAGDVVPIERYPTLTECTLAGEKWLKERKKISKSGNGYICIPRKP